MDPDSLTREGGELERHEHFEELLLEISARIINAPMELLDGTIVAAQQQICSSLGLDCSTLWQWSNQDSDLLTATHYYVIPGGPVIPEGINGEATHPWLYSELLKGKVLAFSTEELPVEAEVDKQTRRHLGAKSSVAIPLRRGNESIFGIISFDTLLGERKWSSKEVQRLRLVAEIMANALVRKQDEVALVENHNRINMAADSAGVGFWELSYPGERVWVSEQIRLLFGFHADEIITFAHFQQAIEPGDWKIITEAIDTAFADGEKFKIEYRLSKRNDRVRWLCSCGTPFFHDDGTPARLLGVSSEITERRELEDRLKEQYAELQLLKEQVEQENVYLREELRVEQGPEHIIGENEEFRQLLHAAENVAATPATVLILGETGTGKGLLAHHIHARSERNDQPFITVNCSALPHNLIESELFGRAKGAFTGADTKQSGRFEVANHGTIFLDEIGEMAFEVQSKLLRVLQDGEFEQLGSSNTIKVDVRVIAATGRDLLQDVRNGRFREDLYYRLNVFPITIPPLRERREDIALFARYFVQKYNKKMKKNIQTIPKRLLEQMEKYHWPGNVRELEHLIERSVILSSGKSLFMGKDVLPPKPDTPTIEPLKDLSTNERDHILDVLRRTNWKIEGRDGAASILNIHPSTLRFRLKKLRITRPT